MRRRETIRRMEHRVNRLVTDFDDYLAYFHREKLLLYDMIVSHRTTMQIFGRYDAAADVLRDEEFFQSLYETLGTWGLNRRGASLVDIDEMKRSFIEQEPRIRELQRLQIDTLPSDQVTDVSSGLWQIIDNVRVGEQQTKIVVGSKALHHVLPNLVPPVDRAHTLKFFDYKQTQLPPVEQRLWGEVYPYFCEIASACADSIQKRVDEAPGTGYDMNTSKTKVIDNAIIGFVRRELRK